MDDDFDLHARVGSFRPNPFGFHDVLGSVWEWCRDACVPYDAPPRPGDGLRGPDAAGTNLDRTKRGGSFMSALGDLRVTRRTIDAPGNTAYNRGVRPARVLETR